MALGRKIAYVNLSTGEVRVNPIPQSLRSHYIGGRILNDYIMFSHGRPGSDPLDSENVLVLGAGLFCGLPVAGASIAVLTAKSPLTGLICHSTHGGFFAGELRWAGFDHVVVRGKAKKPVFIHAEDGVLEIRDAQSLWGMGTAESREKIRHELRDPCVQALCIGPAGESLSRLASAHSDLSRGSHRGGAGAVMGSKNLKAFTARGSLQISVKDPGRALKTSAMLSARAKSSPFCTKFGSGGSFMPFFDLAAVNLLGYPATGNRPSEAFSESDLKSRSAGSSSCLACPVACAMTSRLPGGKLVSEGPDFWQAAAFAPFAGSAGVDGLLEFARLCVSLGIDPVESAMLASWAAGLVREGTVPDKDFGGDCPGFGDSPGILKLVKSMADMTGAGALLGKGGLKASETLGKNAADRLLHAKGMCLPPIAWKSSPAFALAAAVCQTGGDLRMAPWFELAGISDQARDMLRGSPSQYETEIASEPLSSEGRAHLVHWSENCAMTADALGICQYISAVHDLGLPSFVEWSELLSSCTGMLLGPPKIWEAAQRGALLERMFNLREGFSPKADGLPEACLAPAEGASGRARERRRALDPEKFRALIDEYYRLRVLDGRGKPESSALSSLGLDKEPSYML